MNDGAERRLEPADASKCTLVIKQVHGSWPVLPLISTLVTRVLSLSLTLCVEYEGWSVSNEKIRDANEYGQIHFTVFQYNPLQAQRTFPIDVLASSHRPRRTVCLAVRTSHLSCGWPLHHSQSSVHEANLSKIGTHGSQTEPGLVNMVVDWAIWSRILILQPLPRQRCVQVHCLDEAAHRDSTFRVVSPWQPTEVSGSVQRSNHQ